MASRSINFRPSILTSGSPRPSRPMIHTPVGQSAGRQISKQTAHQLKVSGGGSTATAPRQSEVGDLGATLGGAAGGAIGGETGAEIGAAIGGFLAGQLDRPRKGGGGSTSATRTIAANTGAADPCPGRSIRIPGLGCFDPLAAAPGGAPAVVPESGTVMGGGGGAVMGAFGIPAMAPRVVTSMRRECGPGLVLGRDNLCYPKSVLGRRSKYRKWRGAPKPPVTAADMKAIRRAAAARDRVKGLASDVGLKTSRKK